MRCVIACSSTSVTTAFARILRSDLYSRLILPKKSCLILCERLSLPCYILRPTLIYGKVGSYVDRNVSQLLWLLRHLPLLPVPRDSGLRQPIHARQLAALVFHLSHQLACSSTPKTILERIEVGGDTTLSYVDMIRALQLSQPEFDQVHRCRLVPIPNLFSTYNPTLAYFT